MTKWTKLQCPRSHRKPDLFIHLLHFVYIWCFGMILCDLATCVWQQICDKATPCQNLMSHFLITSRVLRDTDDGKHEQLFP